MEQLSNLKTQERFKQNEMLNEYTQLGGNNQCGGVCSGDSAIASTPAVARIIQLKCNQCADSQYDLNDLTGGMS